MNSRKRTCPCHGLPPTHPIHTYIAWLYSLCFILQNLCIVHLKVPAYPNATYSTWYMGTRLFLENQVKCYSCLRSSVNVNFDDYLALCYFWLSMKLNVVGVIFWWKLVLHLTALNIGFKAYSLDIVNYLLDCSVFLQLSKIVLGILQESFEKSRWAT
jgi:hypothetical protein